LEFLRSLTIEERHHLVGSRGDHLYPAVWRSNTVSELQRAYMDWGHLLHGKSWNGISIHEQWTVLSWIFLHNSGRCYFAPPGIVMRDVGVHTEVAEALIVEFACQSGECGLVRPRSEWVRGLHNGGHWIAGVPLCDNCAALVESFGQSWNASEFTHIDIIRTRLWLNRSLDGALATQPFGHMAPIHLCGKSCPFTRRFYAGRPQGKGSRSSRH
jgi:hypothetical protein